MRGLVRSLSLACVLVTACEAGERVAPSVRASVGPAQARFVFHPDEAAALGAVVLSRDARGRPRFLRAVSVPNAGEPEPARAARAYVSRFASVWGDTTGELVEHRVIPLPHGFSAVTFALQAHGVPIRTETVRVLLDPAHGLVSVTGAPPMEELSRTLAWDVPREVAEQVAAAHALGREASDVRTRRVLAARDGTFVPAYEVFVDGVVRGTDARAFEVVVDARDRAVLEVTPLTADDAFTYRVYADEAPPHTPFEGPEESTFPHPTGLPSGVLPGPRASTLVTVEGLITSRPTPDPWLPAAATETRGNNVDAYADMNAPDGFTDGLDFRAALVPGAGFDYTYDTSLDALASPSQQHAALTQLFFTVNWLHDYYYDAGFTEAAGNAQDDVFGRGGMGGDAMRAEAQDAALDGARNNANMMTPDDGIPPRMQIYLWDGRETRALTLVPQGTSYVISTAEFGPADFELTGELALARDDAGVSPSDACEPITNDVGGKVAVVDRGTCLFVDKARHVQTAGAIAMIVVNNVPGASRTNMAGVAPEVTIPCVGLSNDDGLLLRAAMDEAPVTANLVRDVQPKRDASLDGTIVAHEWGHYLHHRLSDCENTKQCRSLSEGWGDFVALHMGLREGDDLDGTYPIAAYSNAASQSDLWYFGLRRAPYSVDREKNALMFEHIARGEPLPTHALAPTVADNAEVHNAGEVWAQVLFDVLVSLARAHGVTEARRRMAAYTVAGLVGTPTQSTFTEARDALLTAMHASDPEDFSRAALAFAGRGMGPCARSPARFSDDLVGVVSSDEAAARFEIRQVTAVDDVTSCDDDGVIDAAESGHVDVTVVNVGTLAGAPTVTLGTGSAGFVLDEQTVTGALVEPFTETTLRFRVHFTDETTRIAALTVRMEPEQTCGASADLVARFEVNADDVPASAFVETFESRHAQFTTDGTAAFVIAEDALTLDAAYTTRYLGRADAFLVSPVFELGGAPFSIGFSHRYVFEIQNGTGLPLDGGVVELRVDGGAWEDALVRAGASYPGVIVDAPFAASPLRGRAAFTGQSPGFPQRREVTLDFGTSLAGHTVQLRFRFASNDSIRSVGWEIDDVAFRGVPSTPFGMVVADQGTCAPREDASVPEDAGADASEPPPTVGRVSGGAGCSAGASGAEAPALVLCMLVLLAQAMRKRAR